MPREPLTIAPYGTVTQFGEARGLTDLEREMLGVLRITSGAISPGCLVTLDLIKRAIASAESRERVTEPEERER